MALISSAGALHCVWSLVFLTFAMDAAALNCYSCTGNSVNTRCVTNPADENQLVFCPADSECATRRITYVEGGLLFDFARGCRSMMVPQGETPNECDSGSSRFVTCITLCRGDLCNTDQGIPSGYANPTTTSPNNATLSHLGENPTTTLRNNASSSPVGESPTTTARNNAPSSHLGENPTTTAHNNAPSSHLGENPTTTASNNATLSRVIENPTTTARNNAQSSPVGEKPTTTARNNAASSRLGENPTTTFLENAASSHIAENPTTASRNNAATLYLAAADKTSLIIFLATASAAMLLRWF